MIFKSRAAAVGAPIGDSKRGTAGSAPLLSLRYSTAHDPVVFKCRLGLVRLLEYQVPLVRTPLFFAGMSLKDIESVVKVCR